MGVIIERRNLRDLDQLAARRGVFHDPEFERMFRLHGPDGTEVQLDDRPKTESRRLTSRYVGTLNALPEYRLGIFLSLEDAKMVAIEKRSATCSLFDDLIDIPKIVVDVDGRRVQQREATHPVIFLFTSDGLQPGPDRELECGVVLKTRGLIPIPPSPIDGLPTVFGTPEPWREIKVSRAHDPKSPWASAATDSKSILQPVPGHLLALASKKKAA